MLLPAAQITPDLEAKTLKAVRKYSKAWAQNARQGHDIARYKGLRTLRVGILAFLVLNRLALGFGSYANFGIRLLSEGLLIGGWYSCGGRLTLWPLAYGRTSWKRAHKALKNVQRTISAE